MEAGVSLVLKGPCKEAEHQRRERRAGDTGPPARSSCARSSQTRDRPRWRIKPVAPARQHGLEDRAPASPHEARGQGRRPVPHLPGLVTPRSSPGSSTASMAPSRRSRITAGQGVVRDSPGPQPQQGGWTELTLQLGDVFQLHVQPWARQRRQTRSASLPRPGRVPARGAGAKGGT